MKRVVIVIMVLTLSFMVGIASAEIIRTDDETMFSQGIELLRQINDPKSIIAAEDVFANITSGYNSSNYFKMYAHALSDVHNENYADALLRFDLLEGNSAFTDMLKRYNLPTCESIKVYAEGRQAEEDGRYDEAFELYTQTDILDSLERLFDLKSKETELLYERAVALYETGEYAASLELFSSLGDYQDSEERVSQIKTLIHEQNIETTSISDQKQESAFPHMLQEDALSNDIINDYYYDPYVLGNTNLTRSEINSIIFADSLEEAGSDAWDVSSASDGSVLAWTIDDVSGKNLIIGSNGGVSSPYNCSYLFARYENLRMISFNGCFYTGETTSMQHMFDRCRNLMEIDVSEFDTSKVANFGFMFSDCTSLTKLDLRTFDISHATILQGMFRNCEYLTSLDISGFVTSSVTDMKYMFYGCKNLTDVDLRQFDTKNVSSMQFMFHGCERLSNIDVHSFDTSNVMTMKNMFYKCAGVSNLDVSGFDTSNVKDMNHMFSGCINLQSIDVTGFDTRNVFDMGYMFSGCTNLKKIEVSGFDTNRTIDMSYMFSGCENLSNIDVSRFETSNVLTMKNMFDRCKSIENIDLRHFDTCKVTDMSHMFSDCFALKIIDVSGFDTTNVVDMNSMFSGCECLDNIDVSGFDTGNVMNMGSMFNNCKVVGRLDTDHFDTSKVTDMNHMFYKCENLETLDVSGFNTSNVTDMNHMFSSCSKLGKLDVRGFDTSQVMNMSEMFNRCSGLKAIDVSGFETSNVTSFYRLFNRCYSLETVDLRSFNTSIVNDFGKMFANCNNLKIISVDDGFVIIKRQTLNTEEMFNECSAKLMYGSTSLSTAEWIKQSTLSIGLKAGDNGDSVKWVQRALVKLHYLSGSADGSFGNKTEDALKEFQKAENLPEDGMLDEESIYRICNCIALSNLPKAAG